MDDRQQPITGSRKRRWLTPVYSREIGSVPIVSEAAWASGPVWTGAENFAATGIRSTDRPVSSEWAIPANQS